MGFLPLGPRDTPRDTRKPTAPAEWIAETKKPRQKPRFSVWRHHPESNWGARICNPLRSHSAMVPWTAGAVADALCTETYLAGTAAAGAAFFTRLGLITRPFLRARVLT